MHFAQHAALVRACWVEGFRDVSSSGQRIELPIAGRGRWVWGGLIKTRTLTLEHGVTLIARTRKKRDVIEKLFPEQIQQKYQDLEQNSHIKQILQAFDKFGNDQSKTSSNGLHQNPQRGGGFFSGVLTALTSVAVVLLVYHWSSRESEHDLLVHKPVTKWSPEEVVLWLEQLGPWASHYKERFLSERVNGRLLLTLAEDEFSNKPYSIENSSHRKAILMELDRVKMLGVKPPQNIWEYKDLHDPTWKQWREFLVKYAFLPYQLIAEFAWDWLEVHYWTSRFIIVNAMLLSVLEVLSFWRLWSRRELKSLPRLMWGHFWKMSTQGLFVAIFWPVIPRFICNCLFYWALYFNPIINIDLVVKEIRRLDTQVV
uniref:Bifunctional apoptosis regulator n=1 Tax=Leptobrachium leishanense TaxID=445787 RepID=A0A8C5PXJ7_9ANUR